MYLPSSKNSFIASSLVLAILDHNAEQEFMDLEDSTPSLPICIHQPPPMLVLAPYHSQVRQKIKGKGANKEEEDSGPEVNSSQSVHDRSTYLPPLFARQNLGHAVIITIPSLFSQSELSIVLSKEDNTGGDK